MSLNTSLPSDYSHIVIILIKKVIECRMGSFSNFMDYYFYFCWVPIKQGLQMNQGESRVQGGVVETVHCCSKMPLTFHSLA